MSTSSSKWPEIVVAVIGSGLLGILLTNIITEYNLPVIEIDVAPGPSPGQNQHRYTTLITNEGNSIAQNLRVTLHYLSGNITYYRIFFNGENATPFISSTLQSALVVNVPRFSPSAVMAISTVIGSTQSPFAVNPIKDSINSKIAKINEIANGSGTDLSNVSLSLSKLAEANESIKLNQGFILSKFNQNEKDILSNLTGAAAENELVDLTGVTELGNLNLSELAKLSNNTTYSIANRSDTKYFTPIAGPEKYKGAWVVSATYDEGGVFKTSGNVSGQPVNLTRPETYLLDRTFPFGSLTSVVIGIALMILGLASFYMRLIKNNRFKDDKLELLVPFIVTGGVVIALSLSYSGLLYKMTHYSGTLLPQ